mgnify:FL=1|jgi:hypothetical protein
MKTVLLQIWNEPMSDYLVVNYILKVAATGLLVLAFSGIGKMIFEIVTNPSQFNNVTFGVFDYI